MQLTCLERESASVLSSANVRLSYKFQRLREQLRAAINSGELQGRLPGERELARRYNANAKTINKALCDLSSDGLVVRKIGKGTFVCGGDNKQDQQQVFACFSADHQPLIEYRQNLIDAVRRALGDFQCSLRMIDHPEGSARQSFAEAARRDVAGFFYYPFEPLSSSMARERNDFLAQAVRRQRFCLVLGDCPESARVNSVAPDHVDAGFRLSEHLFRIGCESIQVYLPSRETRGVELFMGGCQAAAQRHQRSVQQQLIHAAHGAGSAPRSNGQKNGNGNHKPIGVIAVGNTFTAVNRLLQSGVLPAHTALAVFGEPGDQLPARMGITSYDVDIHRMAEWAARLAAEHRPGSRPVEILVPGVVQVRGGGTCDAEASRLCEAVV